jgi:NlpC/P60 family putative phage cell wall peptidase
VIVTDIVAIARTWIGTPYVHQGARRGAGCDCLGLLRGVWAEASASPLQPVPPYTSDWSEPQGDEVLWQALAHQLIAKPRDAPQQGDVLLFRMRQGGVAKHLGLQANTGPHATFIHAYQGHGVRESTFSSPWQRRLVARFSTPERS